MDIIDVDMVVDTVMDTDMAMDTATDADMAMDTATDTDMAMDTAKVCFKLHQTIKYSDNFRVFFILLG